MKSEITLGFYIDAISDIAFSHEKRSMVFITV
jgi:hypothetical protein